jgi:hypothetical protein
MEHEIESQARDRGFERSVLDQLGEAFRRPEFVGSRLASVECFTDLCRVRSEHDNREAMSDFARTASRFPPFDTEVFYRYGEGERPISTLYVARRGAKLPRDF